MLDDPVTVVAAKKQGAYVVHMVYKMAHESAVI